MRSEPDDDEEVAGSEQDVLVVLPLAKGQMGTRQERNAIAALADELEAAVLAAGAGEFDGDEAGGGEFTLFFCGPDVDRLLTVLRPILRHSPVARGAYLVRMVVGADGRGELRRLPL